MTALRGGTMRNIRQWRAAAALAFVSLTVVGGCNWWFVRGHDDPAPISLVADNHGPFRVDVYAVPAVGRTGRRLASVGGSSTDTAAVRWADLQDGRLLVVRVHTVGTRHAWVSPGVRVGDSKTARLDVRMGVDGDLRRSTLSAGLVVVSPASR